MSDVAVQKKCIRIINVYVYQIPAGHLSSDVGQAEADMLYKKLHKRVPEIRMLYVTPEKVGVLSSFSHFLNYGSSTKFQPQILDKSNFDSSLS